MIQLDRSWRSEMELEEVSWKTKFVEEISPFLKCPVCQKVYRDPVISKCGHTFCRQCVLSVTHCPVDNVHCDTTQLVINRLVVGQIEGLQIHCQHGLTQTNGETVLDPAGCPEIILFGNRQEHETSCPYAYVFCPNGSSCGSFRLKELDLHVAQCTLTPCIHKEKGCGFVGTQVERDQHLLTCNYKEPFSDPRSVTDRENDSLKSQVKTLIERVDELEKFKLDATRQLEKSASSLASLQQQIENLTSQLQQVSSKTAMQHKRQSSSSQIETPGTPTKTHHVRRSSSPLGWIQAEKWEMPFQFKCIGTLRGHNDAVWCLCAYRGRLYSAGSDCVIKVWDLDQLAKGCVSSFHGHTNRILCIAKYGSKLYTAGADYTIRCWDIETGGQIEIREGAHDKVICAMAIPGEFVFTASFSVIKVWKTENITLVHTIEDHSHWVRALALSPLKDRLYSGSHNAIRVWETSGNFQSLATISHDAGSVYSLATSKQYIIAGNSGTYNRNIHVFSATTHQFVMHLSSHIGTVTSLVLSLSGRFLFSGSQDKNIMIWNMETMLPIQTLSRHQGQVNAVALCGNYALSGSEDHEIKVFRYFQLQ